MTNKTIEILIPFYGDPELLYRTVDSVLVQRDGDWKLTVVDDCYTDDSVGPWIDAIGDQRVKYLRNESNLGITDNYRKCISIASEELVVFLGCDDLLLPNYVDTIKKAFRLYPEADIIQPGVQVIDEAGNVVNSLVDTVKTRLMMPRGAAPSELSGEIAATSLLHADWLYWPSLAFRRSSIQKYSFRDDFPIIQDLALVIDMITDGATLLLYPKVCFQYRRHSASASSSAAISGKRFLGEERYFTLAETLMAAKGWQRAARAARWHWTSRAHAVTLVPRAIVSRNSAGLRVLGGHIFGRNRTQ